MQSTVSTSRDIILFPVQEGTAARRLPWRFSNRGIAVRLFLTCWLIYGLHFATNTVREIYPTLSLGDRLSFQVTEYAGLHPDIFEIPGRGVFINSNPGASIIGAVPYVIFRPLIDRVVERTQLSRAASPSLDNANYQSPYPMAQEFYRRARERGYDIKFGLASAVFQFFGMAPISALSAVLMFYILIGLKLEVRTALLMTLLYAFATPVFFRTGHLNQNLLVGHCAFFAFAVLWRPWDTAHNRRAPRYFLAGLLCGWAVVLDYSGIVVPIVLGAYAFMRRSTLPTTLKSRHDLPLFALGVILCGLALMAYQWSSFGHPLYPAQRYMPPTQFSHYGYNGMDRPHLDLLWDTSFGMRFGLFTSAPLLLLALWVPGWLRSHKRLVGNLEAWTIVAFTILLFLFSSANQFGRLQFNSGVRYIVPVVPFLFILIAGMFLRMPKLIAVIIGIVATYWSWCLAMYRDTEQGWGVLESIKQITLQGFRLPWLTTLERMGYVSGSASVIPLFVVCTAIIWTLWTVGQQKAARTRSIN
ncbi:MAG TPA: hypothetical protein VIB00_02755 [Pyrinomonadaceae bacterium]